MEGNRLTKNVIKTRIVENRPRFTELQQISNIDQTKGKCTAENIIGMKRMGEKVRVYTWTLNIGTWDEE